MTLRVLSFSTYVLVFGIHTYMVHSRHAYVQYVTNRLRANIYTYSYIHKTEYANGQLLSYWWLMIFVNLILFVKISHKRDWLSIYQKKIYALYFGSRLDSGILKNWLIFPLWIYSFGIINDKKTRQYLKVAYFVQKNINWSINHAHLINLRT